MNTFFKILLLFIGLANGFLSLSQSYNMDFNTIDYGIVKEWRNDTSWFYITNVSNEKWSVLPTFYNQEFLLLSPNGSVLPGQKIRIGVSYYTESKGKFVLEIPFYISSEHSPILLKIKGKIIDFHPLALIFCPNLDPKKPKDDLFKVDSEIEQELKEIEEDVVSILEEEIILEKQKLDTILIVEEIIYDTLWLDSIREKVEQDRIKKNKDIVVIEENNDSLEIVLKDKSKLNDNYALNNIVFLIDISGSMAKQQKLESLKIAMKELVLSLRPEDKISIITYATRAKVIFRTSNYVSKDSLLQLIDSLKADGHSYGKDGLDMAYGLAIDEFIKEGNNTVLLATDGKFNYKEFSENKLYRQAARMNLKKVKLSVLGFGKDKRALSFLKNLARFGRGQYVYVTPDKRDSSLLIELIKEMSFIK